MRAGGGARAAGGGGAARRLAGARRAGGAAGAAARLARLAAGRAARRAGRAAAPAPGPQGVRTPPTLRDHSPSGPGRDLRFLFYSRNLRDSVWNLCCVWVFCLTEVDKKNIFSSLLYTVFITKFFQ